MSGNTAMQATIPGVLGFLDTARLVELAGGARELSLDGWITCPECPIATLRLGFKGEPSVPAVRHERADVGARLEGVPHANHSGFSVRLPISARSDIPREVILFSGELEDGRSVDGMFAIRFDGNVAYPVLRGELPRAAAAVRPEPVRNSKAEVSAQVLRSRLATFLDSDQKLLLPASSSPRCSIIIPTRNRAEALLACLMSLGLEHSLPLEIIVVVDGAMDLTDVVLDHVVGARVIRLDRPRGFATACAQGAEAARGENLIFLQDDCVVAPGAVGAALELLDADPDVAVLAGPLVTPDGLVIEAGREVWSDWRISAIGAGSPVDHFDLQWRREITAAGSTCIAVRRDAFNALGRFSELESIESAAVHLCLSAWRAGKRVVYEPRFLVQCDGRDVAGVDDSVQPDDAAGPIVHKLPRRTLRRERGLTPSSLAERLRMLIYDDAVPLTCRGQGQPRAAAMLRELAADGWHVTFVPSAGPGELSFELYRNVPREVRIAHGLSRQSAKELIVDTASSYDVLLVSRPHNLAEIRALREAGVPLPPVIYDVEAIFAERQIGERAVREGLVLSAEERDSIIKIEMDEIRKADHVIVASPRDRALLERYGIPAAAVVGFVPESKLGPRSFESRSAVLMLGPACDEASPNADALGFVSAEVAPKLQKAGIEVEHVGKVCGSLQERYPGIRFLGARPSLDPVFDTARVFLAPQRYGAGIPLKVIEAAAAGVPCVVSPLVAELLGWSHDSECLVAASPAEWVDAVMRLHGDAKLWERIRVAARRRTTEQYTRQAFCAGLGCLRRIAEIRSDV